MVSLPRGSKDYYALTGHVTLGSLAVDARNGAVVAHCILFWMHYAWSSFCLQWVAIAWCILVGRE